MLPSPHLGGWVFREGAAQGAAERLVRWASGRGLADGQWLGYMWDDPEITSHQDCRYDVGVEVPAPFACDGVVTALPRFQACFRYPPAKLS